VLDPGIKALGVLAEDDQINIGEAGCKMRQILDGPKFANNSKRLRSSTLMLENPPPIGVVTGPLSPTRVRSDGLGQLVWDVFSCIFKASAPAAKLSHSNFTAGCFEDADGGPGNFGADAVAGDECDFVCHGSLCGRGHPVRRS
jgi:hypothetical protein